MRLLVALAAAALSSAFVVDDLNPDNYVPITSHNKAILKAVIRFMVDGDENEVLDNTWRKLSREMKNKWQLLVGTVWCGGPVGRALARRSKPPVRV